MAMTHDLVHYTMEDINNGGTFGYHKNGKLIRFLEYIQEGCDRKWKVIISKGESLPNENKIIKDDSLWFMKLAETLGIDIKKAGKEFITYHDVDGDDYKYYKNSLHYENWSTTDCYTPYNYYKK